MWHYGDCEKDACSQYESENKKVDCLLASPGNKPTEQLNFFTALCMLVAATSVYFGAANTL